MSSNTDSRPGSNSNTTPAGASVLGRPHPSDGAKRPSGSVVSRIGRIPSWILGGLAVLLVLFLVGRTFLGSVTPHFYSGTMLQGDQPASTLDGIYYGDGSEVDLAEFEDELLLIYFGYTYCPDVCPTTLSAVSKGIELLDDDDQERTHLLMVSVDAQRDDPASTDAYAQFFDPRFRGATGDVAAIDRATSLYGIYYKIWEPEAGADADEYAVDHTATLMGVTPDGALRIVWPPEVTSEQLQADIEALLS